MTSTEHFADGFAYGAIITLAITLWIVWGSLVSRDLKSLMSTEKEEA